MSKSKAYANRKLNRKYRPFKDCDELIATWAKMMGYKVKENMMPLIWVRCKSDTSKKTDIGISLVTFVV